MSTSKDIAKQKFGIDLSPMPAPETALMINVDSSKAVETCLKLRESGFSILTMLTAKCKDSGFEMVYMLDNWGTKERVFVFAPLPAQDPKIKSLTPDWEAADWLEREVYDMFGIVFEGHPNLQRIITPENFTGHPLRKDFTDTD
ncbi:MAG: NADH-quinone oxidoreductase subunit C [Caldisericales bacterium]|nr:NADH-quinone oxidoreductase subunit C [Caldisericia bacterium]NMD13821.1 NADH-quinone oxidoreductase subunit C [Caldisericales bacterium]